MVVEEGGGGGGGKGSGSGGGGGREGATMELVSSPPTVEVGVGTTGVEEALGVCCSKGVLGTVDVLVDEEALGVTASARNIAQRHPTHENTSLTVARASQMRVAKLGRVHIKGLCKAPNNDYLSLIQASCNFNSSRS